ncbi:MAG: dockerin type I repeat-containing protein [Clostridia bacterium]|nr:dockerin type I repeat-containing protein [Clostridia bacterium]
MKKTTTKIIALFLCLLTVIQLSAPFASAAYFKDYTLTVNSSKKILNTNTARWSSPKTSFMYENNGRFFIVNVTDKVTVTTYSPEFNKLAETSIAFELPLWGGFFSGKTYNYMVFGQTNTEENTSKETYRIVKYDKTFKRLDSASITGAQCNTTVPFDAGSVAMAENTDGSELTVHTSRERFTSEDGLNHQSQFTVILDTATMTPKNDLQLFQNNHVSHSFNQLVQYNGNTPVLVDHGDAYPRSIVLSQRQANGYYTELDLLDIPGATGANCTGVNLGGFEISENNYIVAVNSIDHSKVTSFDSFNMYGLDKDERNAVLLISAKGNTAEANVKKVYLTDYVNKNLHATAPYLVKISNTKFVAMWKEYKLVESTGYSGSKYFSYEENGVKYVTVDESGNKLEQVQALSAPCNLSDCQPIYSDGKIIWYYEASATERRICTLDLNATAPAYDLGDINFDRKINSADALLVLQHSVKIITLTGEKFTNADVNKDNSINSLDALKILQFSVGKIDQF